MSVYVQATGGSLLMLTNYDSSSMLVAKFSEMEVISVGRVMNFGRLMNRASWWANHIS